MRTRRGARVGGVPPRRPFRSGDRLRRARIVLRPRGRWLRWTLIATPFYAAACTLMVGGLATSDPWGDVAHYEDFARRILAGQIPYHDFYLEYPPAALPAFVLPALFTDGAPDYLRAFKLATAVCGLLTLATIAFILDRLEASRIRAATALGAFAVSPLLLGWVFLNRYDLWAALLVTLALAALVVGQARTTAVTLTLAFAAKVFAAATAPIAAVRLLRTQGRGVVPGVVAAVALTCAAVFGFFLVVAFGGLGNSYYTQATRCLQIESVAATPLLLADQAGVYEARGGGCSPGSIDLPGRAADFAAMLTSLVQVGAVLGVALLYLRGREDRERLVLGFAAAVTAFTVFAKVLSPQFLIWLVPLVPLVAGRRGRLATGLLLAALLLTQIELHGFAGVTIEAWAVWVLAARNALLLTLFVVLADGLRRREATAR